MLTKGTCINIIIYALAKNTFLKALTTINTTVKIILNKFRNSSDILGEILKRLKRRPC